MSILPCIDVRARVSLHCIPKGYTVLTRVTVLCVLDRVQWRHKHTKFTATSWCVLLLHQAVMNSLLLLLALLTHTHTHYQNQQACKYCHQHAMLALQFELQLPFKSISSKAVLVTSGMLPLETNHPHHPRHPRLSPHLMYYKNSTKQSQD